MPSSSSSFPAHASPLLNPIHSPRPRPSRNPSDFDLHNEDYDSSDEAAHTRDRRIPHRTLMGLGIAQDNAQPQSHSRHLPPPSLISPAFTPPSTPGTLTPISDRIPRSVPVDTTQLSGLSSPRLLEELPVVRCVVRARIPTTISGQEMFLHLYTNNTDDKEHLAIVFGPHIRSRSLDAPRPDETEMDRMIRGAYTGRLYPGRMSSKSIGASEGQASPVLKSLVKNKVGAAVAAEGLTFGAQRSRSSSIEGAGSSRSIDHVEKLPQAQHTPSVATNLAEPTTQTHYDTIADPDPFASTPPIVRIHSECYTGETVWSARCDCGEQLEEAARLMSIPLPDPSDPTGPRQPNPGGVIIYLRQEGRGIGLMEKLKAYNLQDLGNDTVDANLLLRHPADARSYGLATSMLVDLGLGGDRGIRLLTNNPDKVRAVEGPEREVRVKERVPMVPLAWKTGGTTGVQGVELEKYLRTKSERMSHMSLSRD